MTTNRYQKIIEFIKTSCFCIRGTSYPVLIFMLKGQYTSMYSIQFRYSESRLLRFNSDFKTQSFGTAEKSLIRKLVWFSTISSLRFGLNFLHLLGSSSSGNGIELVSQSIRSCLSYLLCAPWAQTRQVIWIKAERQKYLIIFALAPTNTEANVLVFSFLEGAWLHFCTRVRLIFFRTFVLNNLNEWLAIEKS